MRRLTTAAADLPGGVHAALDRRLRRDVAAPVALGLSGGGDSHALALIASDWARRHDRRLVILTVDHQLRPESRDWTQACEALAGRLGHEFHALNWTGDKPAQGLPAAARTARHRLLADSARRVGARVVLLGHTASDVDEALAMRTAGSTTPSPREWAPSPVWPEGRDIFLLRPMLGLGRNEIREWLADQGESWIEDPSNSDLRFARPRARAAMPISGAAPSPDLSNDLADLARTACVDPAGVISLPRAALSSPQAAKLIAAASLCAAGTARPPRSDRLERLTALLRGPAAVTATLCGARIEADAHEVRFMREAGEIQRGGLAELHVEGAGVWDGRFEIQSPRPLRIIALAGHAASLPAAECQALRQVPVRARGGLPIVIGPGGAVTCPILQSTGEVVVRSLAQDRLLAACGAVAKEP